MSVFSVITAVREGGDTYLRDTYESVACQRLPPGWSVQWLVQAEGDVHARTRALQRAEGVLTRTLDAGRLLPDEHALARDIEALAAHSDLGWTVAPVLGPHADGRLAPGSSDLAPGRLPPGLLADRLRAGVLTAAEVAATRYTELAVAHGGWTDLPPWDRVGPLLAAEAVVDGWVQEMPGEVRRTNTDRPFPDSGDQHESDTTTRTALVLGRADALRQLGWRWRPSTPVTV
ncbi:GltA [Streptomyces sp. NPDC057253]|uniref:GltA n=1 Tax=Streptomyces sp. NPDC057253 TaxID=3346069 RepID=UPI00363F2EA5